ncbi:hypothetical protein D3C85_423250 [compost metagenome]
MIVPVETASKGTSVPTFTDSCGLVTVKLGKALIVTVTACLAEGQVSPASCASIE